jgi:hypothetical protein
MNKKKNHNNINNYLTPLFTFGNFLNYNISYLNNNKFFAGVIMILLNIGSKLITVQFSKSLEQYVKMNISYQIILFSMAWMGTRDIYTALIITAVFIVLSEYVFNEESSYCVVPKKYRVLQDLIDTNNDGIISEFEIKEAEKILRKAKKEKQKKQQKDLFKQMNEEIYD